MSELPSHRLDHASKNETIILVHGIWMQGVLMQLLAWRLRRFGYQTRTVSYPFLRQSPAQNAKILAEALAKVQTPIVHWAAHSLGGIVWLHFVNSNVELPPGRTVLLGSPVQGSETARRIYSKRWLRPLLGRSVEQGLLGGAPLNLAQRSVGLIRGGGWFSLGRFFIGSTAPGDGVVLHTETTVAGVADTVEVPCSHSMLVFCGRSARKTAEFIASGQF